MRAPAVAVSPAAGNVAAAAVAAAVVPAAVAVPAAACAGGAASAAIASAAAVTAAAAAALAAHAAAAAAAAVVAAAGKLNHPASSLVCGSSSTQKFFSDLLRFGFLTPLLEALAAAAVATAAIGLHRSVMYSPSLRCSTVTRAH